MAVEIVNSAEITRANASPPSRGYAGQANGTLIRIDGTCAVTSGVTAAGATYYRLARVRSLVRMKSAKLWLDAASTTITGDLGLYYSNSPNADGTRPANLGAVINLDHFASAVALAAVVTPTEYLFEAATFLGADTRLPLWNTAASGLTSDPGGFFDIVFTLTATAGAAAVLNGAFEYVMP